MTENKIKTVSDISKLIGNISLKTDLKDYGNEFQLKVIKLIMAEKSFAFRILEILKSTYFSDIYIRRIYDVVKAYLIKYNRAPSIDNVRIILQEQVDEMKKYDNLLKKLETLDLSDREFVIDNTNKFCFSRHANIELEKVANAIKIHEFDKAQNIAFELFKYNSNDTTKIYSLKEHYEMVFDEDKVINPQPTIFPTFNENMQGGPGAGKLVIAVAPSNFGKCFGKGTKIRMYDKTLKNIEDIIDGDLVMGYDGLPRTVEGTTTGFEEMFKVKQKNGIDYVVNKSHILALKRKKYRIVDYKSKKEQKKHEYQNNNQEYENIEVKDYLLRSKNWKNSVAGYKSSLEFKDENIDIDPYFLGLWLGDGHHNGTQITNIDKEILNYCGNYAERLGLKITKYDELTISLNLKKGSINPLKKLLKENKLLKNKHIPHKYLFSSKETRLKLLAGLIDSDGYLANKTNFEIVQKRKELAWQIYILCSSLGFKTKFKEGVYSSVSFSGDVDIIPTLLERKQAKKRKKNFDATMSEIDLESLGYGEYFGFSIKEENKLFLLEDFTVVHNTNMLVAQARRLNEEGKKVVLFTFEIGGTEILRRHLAGLTNSKQADVKYQKEKVENLLNSTKIGDFVLIEEKATRARLTTIVHNLNLLKSQGFFPDCILVDSLNQLKLPEGMKYEGDNRMFEYLAEELRDLAKDEMLPLYTVFQANRQSFGKEVNDEQGIGKAIEPFQVADVLFFFSQTQEMLKRGVCNVNLLKNRLGRKNILLECKYDPDMCIFEEIGEINPQTLMTEAQKEKVKTNALSILDKLKNK